MRPSKKAKLASEERAESDDSDEDFEMIVNDGNRQEEVPVTRDPPDDDGMNDGDGMIVDGGSLATESLPRAPELPTDVIKQIMRSEGMKPADIISMALPFNCGLDEASLKDILMENEWTKFQLFLVWLNDPPRWMRKNFGLKECQFEREPKTPRPLFFEKWDWWNQESWLSDNAYISRYCFPLGGRSSRLYTLTREDYAFVFTITDGFKRCSTHSYASQLTKFIQGYTEVKFSVSRGTDPNHGAWRQRSLRERYTDSCSLSRFCAKVNAKLEVELPAFVESKVEAIMKIMKRRFPQQND